MFIACLLALVGALVAVGLSVLVDSHSLSVVAWALTAASLLAVVVSWGSLTAQAFPTSRFASPRCPAVDASTGDPVAPEDGRIAPVAACPAGPPSGAPTDQALQRVGKQSDWEPRESDRLGLH